MKKIKYLLKRLFGQSYYGFLSPSVLLTKQEVYNVKKLITEPNQNIVLSFENKLSEYLGGGKVVTFASGRMAFYSLLKVWDINRNDEVILTGFTCAVMVNAINRIGAKVIFADIDKDTLGTSASIDHLVTPKTKVIVAQHTFGLPCEIDKIIEVAKKYKIKVIEDCALSLGTIYKGKMLGNWGDAAIFSTDHTKPLNTLVGGFCYTTDSLLFDKIIVFRQSLTSLSSKHQKIIINRYILESKLSRLNHKLFLIINYLDFIKKIFNSKYISPYFVYDSSSYVNNYLDYPYPSPMPSCIAFIGLKSFDNYQKTINFRLEYSKKILSVINNNEYIPKIFFSKDAKIIPLRIPFILNNKGYLDYQFIDDWVWFKSPIVARNELLENYGYEIGNCKNSEEIGKHIMNIPIPLVDTKQIRIIRKLNRLYHAI